MILERKENRQTRWSQYFATVQVQTNRYNRRRQFKQKTANFHGVKGSWKCMTENTESQDEMWLLYCYMYNFSVHLFQLLHFIPWSRSYLLGPSFPPVQSGPSEFGPGVARHYKLGSRVVSMLDSGAERPGFKSQSRRCLRQTVHTHPASVPQAAKLVAALLRVARVTAGLAESNGSRPPGLWLTSPAGWLPRTGISSGTIRSVIEHGLPFYLHFQSVGAGCCNLRPPPAAAHRRRAI